MSLSLSMLVVLSDIWSVSVSMLDCGRLGCFSTFFPCSVLLAFCGWTVSVSDPVSNALCWSWDLSLLDIEESHGAVSCVF